MAADCKITNAMGIILADAIATLVGTNAQAKLNIYSVGGGIPSSADQAITDQVVLASLTMSTDAFAAASDVNPGARIAANSITNCTNASSGTASFFRVTAGTSTNVFVIQGTCATESADMIMNTTAIASGATVAITSYTITVPEG